MLFGRFAKALYAATVAALGSLSAVLVGPAHFSSVKDGQWVTIALAGLVAGGGVYRIPNTRRGGGAS